MLGLLGYMAGGMAKGMGDAMVKEGLAKREAALKMLDYTLNLDREERSRAFQRETGGSLMTDEQGNVSRILGSKAEPVLDATGKPFQVKSSREEFRMLTPDEKAQYGLDPKGAYQVGPDGKISGVGGGGVTVNNLGNIPTGMELIEDPVTGAKRYQPIAGGPEDIKRQEAERTRQNATEQAFAASDVITTAASRARQAAENRLFGGVGQGIAAMNPLTDSAEVQRQIEVLTSNAQVENLNAMRRASPTGGALGAVTERELSMLSAKTGALDPSSPNFIRDLDDYERTLLRIIHGTEQGDAIFFQNRDGGGDTRRRDNGRSQESTGPIINGKRVRDMTDEELEALVNGRTSR